MTDFTSTSDDLIAYAREVAAELAAGHPNYQGVSRDDLKPWQQQQVTFWAINLEGVLARCVPGLLAEIDRLMTDVRALQDERDEARNELLEKWELYRACNGAEVYAVIDPKIRKLYMQLNAKARGDETDVEGDPIEQWNRLVDLTVTAVTRWVVANRWAVNEHQRVEQVEAEVRDLRDELTENERLMIGFRNARNRAEDDRDALQVMVDCVKDEITEAVNRGDAVVTLDDLAGVVGWPVPRPGHLDRPPTSASDAEDDSDV